MEILSQSHLVHQLQSSSPRVQMWAAYHLTERWHENAHEFVGQLIESDIPEIKESALYLIGRQKLTDFAFPVFRIFDSAEGSLKKAAVTTLTELGYSALERCLWEWVEELLSDNEVNHQSLQYASKSLMGFDSENNWWAINDKISSFYNHQIKSLALFGALCESVKTPDQLAQVAHHYSHYRNNFTDPQFINYFLNVFENQEIIDFVRLRTNYGYSMRLIYQECLNILGWNLSADFLEVLEKIDMYCTGQIMDPVPDLLIESIRLMFPEENEFLEEHFLEYFKTILSNWDATIIKIQDQEFFFLLSLPLIRFVKEAEKTCLSDPENNATRIARIYHSPFLRLSFMTKVINLLEDTSWNFGSTPSYYSDFTSDTPKEALWRLVTGQVRAIYYPFSAALPKPWSYQVPFLIPRLVEYYQQNLEHFILTGKHEEIDYALELFKRLPNGEIVELMLKHFTFLINQHFHLFFELIEYLPDQRFTPKLMHHYRDGEDEIRQLIELLCEIYQEPSPFAEKTSSSISHEAMTYVRILCPECHSSYRYSISILYFDQEALEQRHLFTNKEVWTSDSLSCKNCHAALPFNIEDRFLANLYAEMLTAHLLKLSEEEKKALSIYKPLTFPRYFGKKTNPGIFFKKVNADLKSNRLSPNDQSQLLTELGKLYLAIEQLQKAQEAFQQSLDLFNNQHLPLFNLGIIAFRQKNIYEARLHFSRFTRLYSAADFQLEEENLYNLAMHYLEILNRREFKKSTFKLINS
ncbi:MAG: hypothetical protein HQM13_14655 [SAR324 cluster bacterium]|nr:hypothetical protein [SAR324 cluster bacterium]